MAAVLKVIACWVAVFMVGYREAWSADRGKDGNFAAAHP
jgi:hypothetical protein